MKIVSVNTGNDGSTGTIIKNLARAAQQRGHEMIQAYPRGSTDSPANPSDLIICGLYTRLLTRELTYFTGLEGCFSVFSTYKILRKLKKFQPDIIHLHNIHGWYLNFNILFKYIKKHNISVVWTLHDCWSFTGHCPHFQKTQCTKWKTGCFACAQHLDYPKSYLDNSRFMYKLKKKNFLGVKNLITVTPSNWLQGLVKESFMGEYPSETIYNGIDLSIFSPHESNLRQELSCDGKFVVLGVAANWTQAKGLNAVIELAGKLDERYRIVLVGASDEVAKSLPKNVIPVNRQNRPDELAKYYTMADVFVNPTREDVLGLVNIESLACGTPVVTFRTGGCMECIDETCGVSVPKNDLDGLTKQVIRVCEERPYSTECCIRRAKFFSKEKMYLSYLDLYENGFSNKEHSTKKENCAI